MDLYIQADAPGKDKEANWLPAPKGKFLLVMRIYAAAKTPPSILDGDLVRAGGDRRDPVGPGAWTRLKMGPARLRRSTGGKEWGVSTGTRPLKGTEASQRSAG